MLRSHSAAIEIETELRRLDRDVRVEPGRRDLVENLEIVLRDLLELLRLRQVLAEARQDGVDAELLLFLRRRSASSTRSPGMNRVTDLRTNPHLVTWSRSHALVDAASSAFLITLIEESDTWVTARCE